LIGTTESDDVQGVLTRLRNAEIDTVVVGGADTHGLMRGKRVPLEHFEKVLAHGLPICDVFWVMTVDESELVRRPEGHRGYFPSELNGYPDIFGTPDLSTVRIAPWHKHTAFVLCDWRHHDATPIPISPRAVLQAVVERARQIGLDPHVGVELEFYVLRETLRSLESRRPQELTPLNDRASTYGVVMGSQQEPFGRLIRDSITAFGLPLEASNPETGPGQFEINLKYAPAMQAADNAFLFKSAVKEIALQAGFVATFMAKPRSDWAGNSCHLHLSFTDSEGRNVMFDEDEPLSVSLVMRQALAGVLQLMPELTALFAPTTNSYRRFTPYSWAGTTATWGLDNRSAGVRAVIEGRHGTRFEQRQAGGDANPYLAVAALIASALHGIDTCAEPPPPLATDVYSLPPGAVTQLPQSLAEATEVLAASDLAAGLLGDDFVEHYVALKRAELEADRVAVTDWEIARYAEAL
jgi:glutamine synthetase